MKCMTHFHFQFWIFIVFYLVKESSYSLLCKFLWFYEDRIYSSTLAQLSSKLILLSLSVLCQKLSNLDFEYFLMRVLKHTLHASFSSFSKKTVNQSSEKNTQKTPCNVPQHVNLSKFWNFCFWMKRWKEKIEILVTVLAFLNRWYIDLLLCCCWISFDSGAHLQR